jgi:ribosomal protein L11 methyltransferase
MVPDPVHWLEITLEAQSGRLESLEDALLEAGAQAVTLSGAESGSPILEPTPGKVPLWPHTRVTGLFAPQTDTEQTLNHLTALLGSATDTAESCLIEDQDWVRAWLDHYRPMCFGSRLWVCPRGEYPPAEVPNTITVNLDPGLAFGTGTHPSTALCLDWLGREWADNARPEGQQIIDYGCGSGILGIAALKLGAAEAWAVDLDAQALRATEDNAERNGVAANLKALPPAELPDITADVVLANILAAPLTALAPLLATRVRPGGHIVLSGILDRQAESVASAYAPWFHMEAPVSQEVWTRFTVRRKRA